MILIPATTHVISWQKQNLLDTRDYYPKAIIKRAKDNQTLATLNLEDKGGGKYQVKWDVPPDKSNFGTEVLITITIYEDAGQTDVSSMYGAWENEYLIYDWKQVGGGMGGTSFDYREIRRIVEETIKNIPNTNQELSEIKELIKGIEIPEYPEFPKIPEYPKIPEFPKIDLSSLMIEIGGIKKTLKERFVELLGVKSKNDNQEQIIERAIISLENATEKIERAKEEKRDIENKLNYIMEITKKKEEEKKEEMFESIKKAINSTSKSYEPQKETKPLENYKEERRKRILNI